MRKLSLFISMLAAIAVTSCNTTEDFTSPSNEREPITIGLSTFEVSYEDLPSSRAGASSDLLAAQIYEVNGDVATPYANGLFEDWSALSFEGYTNTTYKVVVTMVVDGGNVISMNSENIYGKPFEAAATSAFEYSNVALESLSLSTATLLDGAEYATPNIDRYYGESKTLITAENPTIKTALKRMSFGVKAEGIAEDVTLAIEGAPEVTLASGEMEIFSLENLEAAYTANESAAPYSETKSVEIIRNGASIKSANVEFRRNKLATISVNTVSGELEFDFEVPFEDMYAVLTFEDEDYLAGENYVGGNNWSSLIDIAEYGEKVEGSLLYSATTQYTWTDANNTFLNGVVNEGISWTTYEPDWMFWTGGVVVSNYYLPVVEGTEVTYFNQLSSPTGEASAAGHNGSANFAVVNDGAAGGMGMPTYLSFADETARTIDHLYIAATSYLESLALYGSALTAAISADDFYTVTAIGFDADDEETGRVAYEFAQDGNFVSGWHKWDLSSLGEIVKVRFSITSSVANGYGMTLPTNFAIDDIAVLR